MSTSVREAMAEGTALLREAGGESPRLDAEVLLRAVRGWDRTQLFIGLLDALDDDLLLRYRSLLARRAAGEPVAYLVGEREFMGHRFAVGPGVLVPRPETECLVEWLVARVRAESRWRDRLTAVDVGTGSGAIAYALALELPQARMIAIERSADALPYARENRRRFGLGSRACLVRGDLLGPVASADVIAANLPYLRPDQLHPGIEREPVEALVSGADGLDLYRSLVPQAAAVLRSPGLFAAEIDPSQVEAVVALCRSAFPTATVAVERDLSGLDRFVTVSLG
jgi:release factor glutamine methyltransferase